MQQAKSPLEVLTKDDLVGWFMNPVTKKVRYKLQQEIQEMRDRLGSGWTFHRSNVEKTALETAEIVGKIEGLEFIFNIEGD